MEYYHFKILILSNHCKVKKYNRPYVLSSIFINVFVCNIHKRFFSINMNQVNQENATIEQNFGYQSLHLYYKTEDGRFYIDLSSQKQN